MRIEVWCSPIRLRYDLNRGSRTGRCGGWLGWGGGGRKGWVAADRVPIPSSMPACERRVLSAYIVALASSGAPSAAGTPATRRHRRTARRKQDHLNGIPRCHHTSNKRLLLSSIALAQTQTPLPSRSQLDSNRAEAALDRDPAELLAASSNPESLDAACCLVAAPFVGCASSTHDGQRSSGQVQAGAWHLSAGYCMLAACGRCLARGGA